MIKRYYHDRIVGMIGTIEATGKKYTELEDYHPIYCKSSDVEALEKENEKLRREMDEAVNIIKGFIHSFGAQLWCDKRQEVNDFLSTIKKEREG